jgi:pyruvate/2-oxoglutarate dehydrogenase complex dihydrolipoamide acyltransferase (E2) component
MNVVLDPALYESLEAGSDAVLQEWLASEGEFVHSGQPLARASLVHSLIDVPAPHDGVLEDIVVPVGQTFARGAVLARLIDT